MRSLMDAPDFGAVDADNDQLLLRTFEDHEAFLDLVDMRRFLVIGKKGSGKTAIFKRVLTIHQHDVFTFGHTFSDYPWDYHARQARVDIPEFDKFTHSWKYLILLTASKILLNQDQSIPFDDTSMEAVGKLESFVVDTYGSRDPDVTQIFTPSKSLKLKPSFEFDIKLLKAGISPEAVPMEHLPTVIQDVNRNLLRYTLSTLHPEHKYYICFDQLDLGFDPRNPEYVSRLIGLLLAARDINIAARDAGKSLLVAVFLRDDIYDSLHFEDKNKLTENFVSIIEWDTPRTRKTLRQLMEKRFIEVLAENAHEGISWGDVFNEQQEMPGRQSKYQHILDRTFLRPRDMIKFVNSVLDRHKFRVRAGETDSPKLENPDIHAARIEYSEYFRKELDDEVHKHVPIYEKYLDILRSIGGWQFDRARFDAVAAERPELTDGDGTAIILERLYDYSIVGFYRAGGRGYGGSEYVFRYKEARTRFDGTATRFRVHPGLVEVLGLKKVTVQASGAEIPMEEEEVADN
jgi:hypothetical protein